MEPKLELILDVWREACQHIELRESVGRISAMLATQIPFDNFLIATLDTPTGGVETIGAAVEGGGTRLSEARRVLPADIMGNLIAWCRSPAHFRQPAAQAHRQWPGLIDPSVRGHVLMIPLCHDGDPAGILILTHRHRQAYGQEQESLIQSLRAPFEAALANDRQLRELRRLRAAVEAENRSLLRRLGRKELSDVVVGAESGLRTVMERVDMVARSDAPVVLLGETGTGKEVIAREIHARSRRAAGPLLRVNCGAIAPELIDSELFGHEVGSFTGATTQRKGWFERADGGTLLLDEVAELTLPAQVRLLRVLQDGSLDRVGGQQTIHVDVRIIAATHRDLRTMIAEGRFREDLWYRLAVFPIQLPALRERAADIPALAGHFALRASHRFSLAPQLPTPEDLKLLAEYEWPGNVRELAAVMDRAAILGNGRGLEVARAIGYHGVSRTIAPRHMGSDELPAAPPGHTDATDERVADSLDATMRVHIESVLRRTHGRIQGKFGAARILKINPNTLRARMRKLGIIPKNFRE